MIGLLNLEVVLSRQNTSVLIGASHKSYALKSMVLVVNFIKVAFYYEVYADPTKLFRFVLLITFINI